MLSSSGELLYLGSPSSSATSSSSSSLPLYSYSGPSERPRSQDKKKTRTIESNAFTRTDPQESRAVVSRIEKNKTIKYMSLSYCIFHEGEMKIDVGRQVQKSPE